MDKTSDYEFNKPGVNDNYDIGHQNENWDIVDDALTPTADLAAAPTGNGPGKLVQWVGWFANRIKAITGKTNWWDAPSKTIEELKTDHETHLSDYASMKFGSRPYTGDPSSDITYYIDAAAGNDENNGLSAVNAFKTWGKVLSVIPRFGGYGGITIRIIGNLNEIIVLENILAYGRAAFRIRIVGDTEDADNHSVNGIELYSIVGGHHYSITVSCLTVNGPCKFYGCTGVRISNCKPRNNNGPGVDSISSTVSVASCDFGTDIVQDCIFAQWSLVYSANNTGNGTRNGLRATNAATIGKFGTQPTGTTANEAEAQGGEIR